MAERPDLRKIASNITEALADYDADTLRDILTFVFKEYVVEGPPPFSVQESERIEDLEGLNFAELITALQTRLDVPELALFQVDRGQVSVRAGGQSHALVSQAGALPSTMTPPAPAERPQPGVTVEETVLPQPAPAPRQPDQGAGAPPRAVRGLSISGRPAGGDMMGEESRPTQAAEPKAASTDDKANPPAAAAPEAEPPDEDDASTRFSLLELD
jgi:hypothetical protein